MTAENSAIIMTNERKGHRMVGENVNNASPKRKTKVAGIGHIVCLCSGLHTHRERERERICQMNGRSISDPAQMLLGLLSQVSIDLYVIWRSVLSVFYICLHVSSLFCTFVGKNLLLRLLKEGIVNYDELECCFVLSFYMSRGTVYI